MDNKTPMENAMDYVVPKRSKRIGTYAAVLVICAIIAIFNFRGGGTALTETELGALEAICGAEAGPFTDISGDVKTKDITTKFPAVEKVHNNGTLYAFVVKPIAYNGPISLLVVINSGDNRIFGVRIVEHVETEHYVRDMENMWFVDRFPDKSARDYLQLARLTARNDREIVAITGATVTTEAILNGVNSALGAYKEFVLGETAEAVPYMVRFEPGQGDGPVETGCLSIRAYGSVLAEISLEEIKTLPSVKRTMSINSSSGTTQHAFTGTLLSNVLDRLDPVFRESYGWALAVGVDDYISDIGMDEISAENNVFVMYEDNGEPLERKDGGPGAMRLVVVNDVFGQRFTNYLLEIVLENEAPGR